MPPPAPSERPAVDGVLDPEDAPLRRTPPPHLGRDYCNVFVETAVLDVVVLPPAAPVAARSVPAPRAAEPDRAVVPPAAGVPRATAGSVEPRRSRTVLAAVVVGAASGVLLGLVLVLGLLLVSGVSTATP